MEFDVVCETFLYTCCAYVYFSEFKYHLAHHCEHLLVHLL